MNAAFKCYVYRRYPGGGHQPIQARPGDPQGIAGVKVRRGDLGAIGGWSHFKEFITSQANLSAWQFCGWINPADLQMVRKAHRRSFRG